MICDLRDAPSASDQMIDDVKELLSLGICIRDAVKGATNLQRPS